MSRTPSELPPEFSKSAFTVAQGRTGGLGAKRLRGGDLDRPYKGVRRAADAPAEADGTNDPYQYAAAVLGQACDALELVLPPSAFFSHLTAARLWPLPLPQPADDESIHVGVPADVQPPRRVGVTGHHVSDPWTRSVRRQGRLLVDPTSLFCQLSGFLQVEDLVAVGDALVLVPRFSDDPGDRPWVTMTELTERVDCFRGRGKTRAKAALGLVRPGAESRPESLLRVAVVGSGLPEPLVNVDVYGDDGMFLGCGDLVYEEWRVLAEYDGDHHRSDTRQYEKDIRRIERFRSHGWQVVRITKTAFFADRRACVERIESALRASGWRPLRS